MNNIMVDLETMGITANSAIIAIGACKFDSVLGITDEFYQIVDLSSCIKKGFDVDGETIIWWMKQTDDARKEIFKKGMDIKEALKLFKEWVGTENFRIWGNGADFDNTILANAFHKFGVMKPWPYHSNRCFRTVKYSFDKIEIPDSGVAHKAIDDAKWQATYLIELNKKLKLKNLI
jgi:DNA polymerase III epsilon subunit-like protein